MTAQRSSEVFTPEFVDDFLFKKGLQLKDYFIQVTPVSESICFLDNGEKEFFLVISNNELERLVRRRLLDLGVRVVKL